MHPSIAQPTQSPAKAKPARAQATLSPQAGPMGLAPKAPLGPEPGATSQAPLPAVGAPLSSRAFEDDLVSRPWAALEVQGKLPEALVGTLYRMGPTGFDWPQGGYQHWFDAHGVVHAIRLGPTGAFHSNRLVQTPALARDRRNGQAGSSFGTSPQGLWAKLKAPFEPFLGTANTNLIPWGDRLLALQESGMVPMALDPDSLETLGEERFGYMAKGDSFSAHPRWDPLRREAVAANVRYGRQASVDVVTLKASGERSHSFTIPLPYAPALVHDMGLSQNHAVVFAFPQVTRPLGLLLGWENLGYGAKWKPELGAFAYVAKRDGSGLRRHELPPMFSFHVANAFDEGEDVVVDLVSFGHGDVLARLGRIRHEVPQLQDAQYLRLRLKANGQTESQVLANRFMEFPRTLAAWQGQAHAYSFLTGERPARRAETGLSGWLGAIWQVGEGVEAHWEAPTGWLLGEPVPVAKGPATPHAAWLLVVAYVPEEHRSRLLVLDGEALAQGPVAQVLLPVHLPPGFHGQFQPA